MKPQAKGCLVSFLIVLSVLLAFVLGTVGYFFISLNKMGKQAEIDGVEQGRVCDTVKYVTEQPEIGFSGFTKEEISELRFQLLRNGELIADTLVKSVFTYESENGSYKTMPIPYNSFLKTDTIVLTTANQLYYYLWGYHHYAYLHYGMFGYVGSHDCRLSKGCYVNGQYYSYNASISRSEGYIAPLSSGFRHERIYRDTPEFDEFEIKSPVKYEEACRIYTRRTSYASPIFLYCENGFYIFGRDAGAANRTGIYKILKINATTGECVEVDDFPEKQ